MALAGRPMHATEESESKEASSQHALQMGDGSGSYGEIHCKNSL
eukprot:COSAG01_NODE_15345_length_1347_cov_22.149038_1_plen_43_part_10